MIGLPSLAQLDHQAATRIWLAAAPADMRCGFDRLAELARSVTNQNPLSGHLFLFRSRGGDRLKLLYWDRDGYVVPSAQCPRDRDWQGLVSMASFVSKGGADLFRAQAGKRACDSLPHH